MAVTVGSALVVAGVVGTSLRDVSGAPPVGASDETPVSGAGATVGDSGGVVAGAIVAGSDDGVLTALDDGVVDVLDSLPLSLPPQAVDSRATATAAVAAANVEGRRVDRIAVMGAPNVVEKLSAEWPGRARSKPSFKAVNRKFTG